MSLIGASSSPGCSQSGAVLTGTGGTMAVAGVASLTVVMQPGNSAASTLTFQASSASGDFNLLGEVLKLALNQSPNEADSYGPMPLWSIGVLGALLLGFGSLVKRETL